MGNGIFNPKQTDCEAVMRDVERAKMVPRGMTSETLTSATLLVVSFGGKYKPASFALWCGSGSVVC